MSEKNRAQVNAMEDVLLAQVSGGAKNSGYRCPKCGAGVEMLRKGGVTFTCGVCHYTAHFDAFYCSDLNEAYTIYNPDGTVTTAGGW